MILQRVKLLAQALTVSPAKAKTLVHEQLTVYPGSVVQYLPHAPFTKTQPNLEPVYDEADEPKTKRGQSLNREQNQLDSMRKAVKRVKDYARWNQFELFATFTFKADRQDVDKCFQKITSWFKNEQYRKGKIEYVIIPEWHKDEQSLHFHALIKGYKGELKPSISAKTGRQIRKNGRLYYEFPSYQSGFSNVKKIENTPEDQERTGNYVAKYITKSLVDFFGKQRYRVSNGLELPPKIDNPEPGWNDGLKPIWSRTNEHGTLTGYELPPEVES